MIIANKIPLKAGVFIDCYNQSTNENITATITTRISSSNHYFVVVENEKEKKDTKRGYAPSYRIRKLTPRECFRLMDVRESNIDKIQNANISNSQQYKLAGNSIVVDNLFHIFRKLLIETDAQEQDQLSLF